MSFARFVIRNACRSPWRGVLTVLSVAVALLAFIFLRSLTESQEAKIKQTPNNRVVTRPSLGWVSSMPASHAEAVRQLPDVKQVTASRWAGLVVPGKEEIFFNSDAVDAVPFIAMHHEVDAPSEQKQAFLSDTMGALISADLAQEFGWQPGDRVIFHSRQFEGELALNISGIYRSAREGFGARTLWLRYDYLNRSLPAGDRDRIGVISAEVFRPNDGARIARAIDLRFESSQFPTLTMEDKALTASTVGRFGAILNAMNVIGYFILAMVSLILGNTIAMCAAERSREYGVLLALGFSTRLVGALVLLEAAIFGCAGGVLALLVSRPLLQGVVSPMLVDVMEFAALEVRTEIAVLAFGAGAVLAVVAGGLPAYRVSRISAVDVLKSVG